jgi:hypothetical protein
MVAAEAGVLAVRTGSAQAEAQAVVLLWTPPVAVEAAVEAARREARLALLVGTAVPQPEPPDPTPKPPVKAKPLPLLHDAPTALMT